MSESTRLDMEVELIKAMYPEQIHYDEKSRELKYTDNGAILLLRLPESYPEQGHPDIISATNTTRTDIRSTTRTSIATLDLTEGEESLDAIIAEFQHLIQQQEEEPVSSTHIDSPNTPAPNPTSASPTHSTAPKTVIIWLHHLLNTNKRKLALSPPPPVSGLTKPGYPGVLLYSGPSNLVTQHVNTLKAQNWAAFQVRYEEDVAWTLTHGKGVKECESMSEIVKSVGVERKEEFLRAVGIK